MKKINIALFTLLCVTMFISCKKEQVKTGIETGTKKESSSANIDLRMFEQEGFITKDLFRIIVVRPAGSSASDADVQKQAQNKTLMSLKKYITSSGKSLQSNADAQLLNLISGNSTLTPYDDRDAKRTVFVLEITKPGLRAYVDNLGK